MRETRWDDEGNRKIENVGRDDIVCELEGINMKREESKSIAHDRA